MRLPRLTFGLALLVSLAACSARGGSGGGGTTTDPDASTPNDTTMVPMGTCTALCARVTAASGCPSDPAMCMSGCATLFSAAACSAQSAAFAACANTASITCSGDTPNFGGCESLQTALVTCITSTPPVDASVTPDATVGPDVPTSPDVPASPDSTVGPDVPVGDACSRVCARLASMASCASAFASCTTQCSALSAVPPACSAAVNAFFSCATASPVTCSGTTANFTACTTQQSAVLACISGGTVDASVPDVPVPTGDPTAPCTGSYSGLGRECGWQRGGTFSCTPGRSYTVGCNSTAGTAAPCTPTLGACTGDSVMRVCAGTTTCSASTALIDADDSCGTCPVETVVCPPSGQVTVLVGSYSSTAAGTCTPALR